MLRCLNCGAEDAWTTKPAGDYCVNCAEGEIERLTKALQEQSHEIEQTLGKALGYPAYRDDPANFPNVSPDDDSVCVGEHVPETLAAEASKRIEQLNKKLGRCNLIMNEAADKIEERLEKIERLKKALKIVCQKYAESAEMWSPTFYGEPVERKESRIAANATQFEKESVDKAREAKDD